MWQVKVPSWGTKSSSSSFQLVGTAADSPAPGNAIPSESSPKQTNTKKRKHDEKSESSTSVVESKQPQNKKVKRNEDGSASKAKQQPGPSNTSSPSLVPKQSKPENPKNTKSANPPTKQTKVDPQTKKAPQAQRKSDKPAERPSTSSKQFDKQKKVEPKVVKKGKKVQLEESEDSIDELFGNYGGDDSEMSFTSDEAGSEDSENQIVVYSEDELEASSLSGSNKDEDSVSGFSSDSEDTPYTSSKPSNPSNTKLSDLQSKMKAKLEGGQFRFINEKLYTSTGKEAFSLFQQEPVLFDVYHQGYRNQVEKWPQNPLDLIIDYLKKQPKTWVVADFGCGEARLAQSVPQKTVHSFDLVARNKYITACDIAHVPLKDSTVDVAVFCLSLMGNNVHDFLKEAYRVLKPGGVLKIAEVKSRFDKLTTFLTGLTKAGFDLKQKDESNKMFVMFDCIKASRKPETGLQIKLKPCIYKRR